MLAESDPNLAVINIRTLEQQIDRTFDQPRAVASLAGLFGAEGQPFGALGVGFEDERRLRHHDAQLLQDVAAQCALALDRARLAVAAERDQERLRFLDRLSGTLSSTLRLDATLTELAGLAVPQISDWCVVRLVKSAMNPRPIVGAAHVDPDRVDAMRSLAERIPGDLEHVDHLGEALQATVNLSAAKTWRFAPAVKDGRPVKYRKLVQVWLTAP